MDDPTNRHYSYVFNTVTIGVFDSFDIAAIEGNKVLEYLESEYKPHIFPDGKQALKQRFSKHGGVFGSNKNLVTNLAYLKTPFDFYARIITPKYESVADTLSEIEAAITRYNSYLIQRSDEDLNNYEY